MQMLRDALHDVAPRAVVFGRAKSIGSAWRKMRAKCLSADEICDLIGLRVLVHTVAQCYETLQIVHTLWRPLDGQLDDYIAVPKTNGYRCLHTAVLTDEGLCIEVQIRTHAMHKYNEEGPAAHQHYKQVACGGEWSSRPLPGRGHVPRA